MSPKDIQRLVSILALNTVLIVTSAQKLRWLQIALVLIIVLLSIAWITDAQKEKKHER